MCSLIMVRALEVCSFADYFVGMSDSSHNLQKLIDVHKFCNEWRLKANVSKCVVVVFSKSKVPGSWTYHSTSIKLLELILHLMVGGILM